MPRYVDLTMPRTEAVALLAEFDGLYCGDRGIEHPEAARLVARLRAALRGRDLRASNRHNVHAKRPRVGLDLRRKSA